MPGNLKIQNAFKAPADSEDIADLAMAPVTLNAVTADAGCVLMVFHDGTSDVFVSSVKPLPVSAASLPLPSGAATAANQATHNTHLAALAAKSADFDTGPGTDTIVMHGIALPASGGAVIGGTSSNPFRTDPTGTTTQPVSGAVTANAGTNLNTSALALEAGGNLAAAAASLNTLDDWDEGDRCKSNPIVGQAGVQGGSGVATANTQRVALATDVPPALMNNRTASATLNALNAAVTIDGNGAGTVYFEITTGDLNATVSFEATLDDSTWFAVRFYDNVQVGLSSSAGTFNFIGIADSLRGVIVGGGYSQVRARLSAFTSGTAAARLEAAQHSFPRVVTVQDTVTVSGNVGTDGVVSHDASATTAQPVLVGGYAFAAAPADVSADNDAVKAWYLRNGSQVVNLAAGGTLITANGANLNINAALIGGNSVTMGNGVAATGTQRVTLASDSTGSIAAITTSVNPGTGATHLGKVEDSGHSSGDTGVMMLARRNDAPANSAGSDNDYCTVNVNAEGGVWVTPTGSALGGLSTFRSLDLDETEEDVKTAAGTVYLIVAMNRTATPLYLKLYNATAANVTVGTTTPLITIPIPANADSDVAGFVLPIDLGIAFSTAISAAVTTGVADADTGAPGANDAVVQIFYK